MASLSNLSYVVIYSVNWTKIASKSHFHFAVKEKKAKKAIFWNEIYFFVNKTRFGLKHF